MLLVSCYMPCDTLANADMFCQVLGALQELKTRYSPDYVIYGGDFKVLEKCAKNLIGHSRLAFNNHESNIDC